MSTINFKVNDSGVSSFMDTMRQKSSRMTSDLIQDAQKQTNVAKEQLQIVEKQIAAQLRRVKLESDYLALSIREGRDARVSNIDRRGQTIDLLSETNKQRFKAGEITREEYRTRRARIEGLADRNTEVGITQESNESLQRNREEARGQELLARYMRENIETVRDTSGNELRQMRRGDADLVNAIDENGEPTARLANQLASQQFESERGEQPSRSKKFLNDTLTLANAITLEKVGSMISNIPNTKNELDFVKPLMSAAGMVAGGLTGQVADAIAGASVFGFSLGQTSFGPLGAQLGEKMGEFAGSAIERSFRGREELTTRNYRLQALVGQDLGVKGFAVGALGATGGISKYNQDLSKYGLNYSEVSDLQYNVAARKGRSNNLGRDSENIIALQQGLGVKQETSFAMLELMRSNRDSDKNVMNIVGGALQKGQGSLFKDGDRSFLNEFLTRNYTQLQRALLTTQNTVASGTAFDIIKKFDSIGGPFAARDSRSSGLINQIQGSLANPGSDNLKALAFTVMRRQNPNMGLSGLLEEQQKGLASPSYLKSMLEMVDQMGGDKDMKIMNVAGMFGLQNNIAAARKIYENRKGLLSGKISVDQLKGTGQFGEDSIRALGEEQTGKYTSSTAEIENAFIESAVTGVKVVGEKMKGLMGDMMDGMSKYVKQEIGKMLIDDKPKPKFNKTKTYKENGLNSDGTINRSSSQNRQI